MVLLFGMLAFRSTLPEFLRTATERRLGHGTWQWNIVILIWFITVSITFWNETAVLYHTRNASFAYSLCMKLNSIPKNIKPWRTNDVCLYYKTCWADILGTKTNTEGRIGSKKVTAESHDENWQLRVAKLLAISTTMDGLLRTRIAWNFIRSSMTSSHKNCSSNWFDSTPASYLGVLAFDSRPGEWLSWSRWLMIFLNPPRKYWYSTLKQDTLLLPDSLRVKIVSDPHI